MRIQRINNDTSRSTTSRTQGNNFDSTRFTGAKLSTVSPHADVITHCKVLLLKKNVWPFKLKAALRLLQNSVEMLVGEGAAIPNAKNARKAISENLELLESSKNYQQSFVKDGVDLQYNLALFSKKLKEFKNGDNVDDIISFVKGTKDSYKGFNLYGFLDHEFIPFLQQPKNKALALDFLEKTKIKKKSQTLNDLMLRIKVLGGLGHTKEHSLEVLSYFNGRGIEKDILNGSVGTISNSSLIHAVAQYAVSRIRIRRLIESLD